MGREIRRVPANWQHPKAMCKRLVMNDTGDIICDFLMAAAKSRYEMREEYRPLYDQSYEDAMREWSDGQALWRKGEHPDQHNSKAARGMTWEEWNDGAPDPNYYRPHWTSEEATHYQMYETVSEGTPVSPVFATLDDLADWLVGQGYSPQSAKVFCASGWAPSMVMVPGMGVKDGITAGGIFAAKEREHSDD